MRLAAHAHPEQAAWESWIHGQPRNKLTSTSVVVRHESARATSVLSETTIASRLATSAAALSAALSSTACDGRPLIFGLAVTAIPLGIGLFYFMNRYLQLKDLMSKSGVSLLDFDKAAWDLRKAIKEERWNRARKILDKTHKYYKSGQWNVYRIQEEVKNSPIHTMVPADIIARAAEFGGHEDKYGLSQGGSPELALDLLIVLATRNEWILIKNAINGMHGYYDVAMLACNKAIEKELFHHSRLLTLFGKRLVSERYFDDYGKPIDALTQMGEYDKARKLCMHAGEKFDMNVEDIQDLKPFDSGVDELLATLRNDIENKDGKSVRRHLAWVDEKWLFNANRIKVQQIIAEQATDDMPIDVLVKTATLLIGRAIGGKDVDVGTTLKIITILAQREAWDGVPQAFRKMNWNIRWSSLYRLVQTISGKDGHLAQLFKSAGQAAIDERHYEAVCETVEGLSLTGSREDTSALIEQAKEALELRQKPYKALLKYGGLIGSIDSQNGDIFIFGRPKPFITLQQLTQQHASHDHQPGPREYFEILGLKPTADLTDEEVDAAYRKALDDHRKALSEILGPNVEPMHDPTTELIKEAYRRLAFSESRKRYLDKLRNNDDH